jgi:predicted glycosyltransferase
MHVWIDLANSPHVALFEPVVERLQGDGTAVTLTARDHAQTLGLAERAFGQVRVVGGESPPGLVRKGVSVAARARDLVRVARSMRPDVALSHGSYAQILAARAARVPAVTMMDYEFQPANHLSFRIADRVLVPAVFPEDALRRCGARTAKVVRYEGFKEELYLGRFRPDCRVLSELGVDGSHVVVVMRPAPQGALYHRGGNERFGELLGAAAARDDVRVVLLPRTTGQADGWAASPRVVVPQRPVDGRSLLACADLMIGAGGTMNREAALLGTPTYTLFAQRLAAVDRELIRRGLLHDLTGERALPIFAKKPERDPRAAADRAEQILGTILETLATVTRRGAPAGGRAR